MAEQTNVHTTNQQSSALLKLTTGSGAATSWGRGTHQRPDAAEHLVTQLNRAEEACPGKA